MSERANITCEGVHDLLLRGEERSEAHVDHLHACVACRAYAARLVLLDDALESGDPRPDPIPQVSGAVMDELRARRDRRLRLSDLAFAAAGVACAALLTGTLYWLFSEKGLSQRMTGVLGQLYSGDLPSASYFLQQIDSSGLSLSSLDLTTVLGLFTALGASLILRMIVSEA